MADSHITGCFDAFSKQLGSASMMDSSSNDFYDESETLSEFEKTLSRIDDISVKIKLTDNKPLVWKAEEWLKLQKNRIHGTLIGTPANFPKQVSENGLPLLLLPEEVTLIIEKNMGKLFSYRKNRTFPSDKVKEEYSEYLRKNKEEQEAYYKKLCKEQVLERIDLIIEGKKRKSLSKQQNTEGTTSESELDREVLLQNEIERKVKAATASNLIQIPTASPWLAEEDLEEVEWTYPETSKEKLKYRVFKDLYEKGYSLTPCAKFGGDFLVYPGEPWKFHAYFIVICLEFDEEFKLSDLVSNSRVSVFTRKNLVLASIDEDNELHYNTLTWPTKMSV
ncbi:tRNA-splicing endonuclease subunit Sen34 [Halyomorpha halys]|uniref:tRNA-splicing endonuclease subunit Sen34 n=1 Tax=Halyomorpha halys TaxID=286706 RepID=UPI0006D513B4|nr:tRNA-splicing endonuclease subunit Sen34 isoform X1 [Halyomorpha halys]